MPGAEVIPDFAFAAILPPICCQSMKRLIPPLLALLVQGALQADPVQDLIDASPKLDAPGPGLTGRQAIYEAIQVEVKAPVWPAPSSPKAIDPWSESFMIRDQAAPSVGKPPAENPAIDYQTFAKNVDTVGSLREKRRISEEEFLRMAGEPDTIILDARSHDKYAGVHIKGAVNLPLPDMNADDLARVIPSKTTKVLIYCNNNFEDLSAPRAATSGPGEKVSKPDAKIPAPSVNSASPEQSSKPYKDKGFVVFRKGGDGAILLKRKTAPASLNIYTFNTLYAYGYTNVYELGPLIEIQNSILPFEGTRVLPKE
jgi:hypothetical protein